MHSNEQVIEKTLEVEEKLSENSQQIMDMQKNQMDEKLQDVYKRQAQGMGADPRAVLMACVIGGSCAYALSLIHI